MVRNGPPRGPVRTTLDAVKLLHQRVLHGAKTSSLTHLGGLKRVTVQYIDQRQMKVRPTL